MWGSFLVATTVTVVSAVLSLLTGYAFGTMRFRGSGILFNLIVVGLIFPYEATVIPLYYDFLNYHPVGINLAGSYWALILPQIGQSVTLGTFWMRAFFLSTPKALVDAPRLDERLRRAQEERAHPERPERHRLPDLRQDQRPVGAREVDAHGVVVEEVVVERDDRRLVREDQPDHDEVEEDARAAEAHRAERVARQQREHRRDDGHGRRDQEAAPHPCLLYTSDAADEED